MNRQLLLLSVTLSLTACAPLPPRDSLPLECNEARKLCYRGNVIDRVATRERFGDAGTLAINRDMFQDRE